MGEYWQWDSLHDLLPNGDELFIEDRAEGLLTSPGSLDITPDLFSQWEEGALQPSWSHDRASVWGSTSWLALAGQQLHKCLGGDRCWVQVRKTVSVSHEILLTPQLRQQARLCLRGGHGMLAGANLMTLNRCQTAKLQHSKTTELHVTTDEPNVIYLCSGAEPKAKPGRKQHTVPHWLSPNDAASASAGKHPGWQRLSKHCLMLRDPRQAETLRFLVDLCKCCNFLITSHEVVTTLQHQTCQKILLEYSLLQRKKYLFFFLQVFPHFRIFLL